MGNTAEAAERRARLGRYFLARLTRLVELRQAWRANIGTERPELLEHALFSTYIDCSRLGLQMEARELLDCSDAECRGSWDDQALA